MARNREVKVVPVLADEGPSYEAVPCHESGPVDSLHGSE